MDEPREFIDTTPETDPATDTRHAFMNHKEFNGYLSDHIYFGAFTHGCGNESTIVPEERISFYIAKSKPTFAILTYIDDQSMYKSMYIRTQEDALKAISAIYYSRRDNLIRHLLHNKLYAETLEQLKKQHPAINNLYQQIEQLEKYATTLPPEDETRATHAYGLATSLTEAADNFFANMLIKDPTQEDITAFKASFKTLTQSKDPVLGQHRNIIKPIMANILIALTGVGLIFIIAKIAYEASTAPKCKDLSFNKLFFFGRTQLQNCSLEVSNALEPALPNLPVF